MRAARLFGLSSAHRMPIWGSRGSRGLRQGGPIGIFTGEMPLPDAAEGVSERVTQRWPTRWKTRQIGCTYGANIR
eukprot:1192208-Prorocentrum_minimum.AAC.16